MDEQMNNQTQPEITQAPAQSVPEENALVWVADIHFRTGSKVYFFDPGDLQLSAGDHVIIDTARGLEYGICAGGNHQVKESEVVAPLRKVIRLATAQDEKIAAENQEKEKNAFQTCMQKIQDHKLDMQLVSAEYAFDGSKILFFFTADGRVDFRELVKDLASVFRTRIELRQIGVRDKAKMVGGLGICGRPFCCGEFLDDFQPVSIKMAKTQNLSLNPTKISGTCGRLMCCLKYEQDAYEDLLKTSPKMESFVDTPDGRGTVTEVNLLRQSVKVRMEDHPETISSYKNCDICVLRSGKAKKNDAPIPKDLAPISSKPKAPAQDLPEPKFLAKDPKKADFFQFATDETETAEPAEEKSGEKREGGSHRSRNRRRRSGGERKPRQEGGEKVQAADNAPSKSRREQAQNKAQQPKAPAAPKEGGEEVKHHSNRRRGGHRRGGRRPGSKSGEGQSKSE